MNFGGDRAPYNNNNNNNRSEGVINTIYKKPMLCERNNRSVLNFRWKISAYCI